MTVRELSLQIDTLWCAVSPNSKGSPVRIKKVTPNQVMFQAIGRSGDSSQTFSLKKGAFLNRYSPLEQADDDAKTLGRMERNGTLPKPDATPVPSPAEPIKIAVPRRHRLKLSDLTPEQIQEIKALKLSGATYSDIGPAYNITNDTLAEIVRGLTKPGRLIDPTPTPTPSPTPQEVAPTVQDLPTPNISRNQRSDELLLDCAEALKLLVEYHGKPLPKYVQIDMNAITALVSNAIRHAKSDS